MKRYLVNKFMHLSFMMLLISFFSFAVIYFAPGDISSMYITDDMSEQQVAQIKEELGVNQKLSEQYFNWASKAIQGDFGVSLSNKAPVLPIIKRRLPATLYLMGAALILSILLAIPLGLLSGYYEGKWIDKLISLLAYSGMSIPSFWFGMVLIIIFSAHLKLLPSSGIQTVGVHTLKDKIEHLIMPCLTLSIGSMATYIRYIRANTIKELNEEYIFAAQARGTSGWKLLRKHVLKNTLLPIITLIGMNLSSLVAGSFIIETIFGWPGIGTTAMTAINQRDYPIIMVYILLSGGLLVIGNLIAELLYAVIDPRIKAKG